MLRSEKTRPKISFSSSACERPRCVGAAPGPSWGAVEAREALEVGRVVLEALEVPEDEAGRGVQRRLYMHSAGGLLAGGVQVQWAARTVAVEDVEAVEDHGGGRRRGRWAARGSWGEGAGTCAGPRGSSGMLARAVQRCGYVVAGVAAGVAAQHARGTLSEAVHGTADRQVGATFRWRLKQAPANGRLGCRVGLPCEASHDVVRGSGDNVRQARSSSAAGQRREHCGRRPGVGALWSAVDSRCVLAARVPEAAGSFFEPAGLALWPRCVVR